MGKKHKKQIRSADMDESPSKKRRSQSREAEIIEMSTAECSPHRSKMSTPGRRSPWTVEENSSEESSDKEENSETVHHRKVDSPRSAAFVTSNEDVMIVEAGEGKEDIRSEKAYIDDRKKKHGKTKVIKDKEQSQRSQEVGHKSQVREEYWYEEDNRLMYNEECRRRESDTELEEYHTKKNRGKSRKKKKPTSHSPQTERRSRQDWYEEEEREIDNEAHSGIEMEEVDGAAENNRGRRRRNEDIYEREYRERYSERFGYHSDCREREGRHNVNYDRREDQHARGNRSRGYSDHKGRNVHEDKPKFHAMKSKNDIILIVEKQDLCLKGRCCMKCLLGQVNVLGYALKPGDDFVDIFSPESNSLLTLRCTFPENSSETRNKVSSIYSKLITNETKENREKLPKENIVILLLRQQTSFFCDYVMTLSPYQNLFKVSGANESTDGANKLLSVDVQYIDSKSRFPRITISEDYEFVFGKWQKALSADAYPIVMICGGKNTGKSTLNRFFVNRTLNSIKGVYYLECDVGQTELTPPGCISLHYVQKPLLGPPFCHQMMSENSFYFGCTSPANNPNYYMKCVQRCVEGYQQSKIKAPLIVNTMGWTKGLGLDLLVDTLRMVQPSLVIQLDCARQHMNFPPLTPHNVAQEIGWMGKSKMKLMKSPTFDSPLNHELIILDAPMNPQKINYSPVNMKPVDHRNLSLISYLAKNLDPGMTLTSQKPFTVSWSDIAIYVHHQSIPVSQIMYAINAAVIALCVASHKKAVRDCEDEPWRFTSPPICKCVGFGFVRGIDPAKKEIYIVTPLLSYQLRRVNTLVKGDLNIPDQILMNQQTKQLPYVSMTTSSVSSSSLQQRKHMPRRDKCDVHW